MKSKTNIYIFSYMEHYSCSIIHTKWFQVFVLLHLAFLVHYMNGKWQQLFIPYINTMWSPTVSLCSMQISLCATSSSAKSLQTYLATEWHCFSVWHWHCVSVTNILTGYASDENCCTSKLTRHMAYYKTFPAEVKVVFSTLRFILWTPWKQHCCRVTTH